MAEAVTLDEVWRLFRENAEQLRTLEHRFRETDDKFRETDEKFRETAERLRETDGLIRELRAETRDRARQQDKTVNELSRNIGRLGNSLGAFAEGMVLPAAEALFTARGLDVRYVYPNAKSRLGDRIMEIDILLVDGSEAVAIEVKNRLKVADVNEHLERLADFKLFFREYADKHVIGAVAGLAIEESAGRYAYHKGLYVIGQRGDAVTILNDDRFEPRIW